MPLRLALTFYIEGSDKKLDSNNNIENIAISAEKLQEYLNTACLFEDDYFKIFMQNQTYKSVEFMLRTILKNPFLQVKNKL